jgi:uncharacterized membrane protein YeaQ/YmgE (transglycosylase-associated protein family)
MNYVIWVLVGAVIALLVGAGPRRRAYRPNANASVFAGAFGALIGGVISDGVPHAFSGSITLLSLVGAALGALIFCWAVRDRASDVEP